MVRTKSVFDPPLESDGLRVLVSRYWPRGVSREKSKIHAYQRTLAPSVRLLSDWKVRRITTWEEYEKRYNDEMACRLPEIAQLAEKSAAGTITLLCFEPERDPHCHRHLLKGMIDGYALKHFVKTQTEKG